MFSALGVALIVHHERLANFQNLGRKILQKILLKSYNIDMVFTWDEIVKIEGGISNAYLSVEKRKYKRVSHGIYVDDGEFISELEQLFARYPRATLTLQSAFEHYELSDFVPDKYYLVTPYNAHVIDSAKVCQSYMDEATMQIGREKVLTQYGHIFIFDKERMLIELFRLRNKFGNDYFMEVVSSYRILKAMGVLNMRTVCDYCQRINRGGRILKQIMEVI